MVGWLHRFGACGEAEHLGREYVVEKSHLPDGDWEASKNEREGKAGLESQSRLQGPPVT